MDINIFIDTYVYIYIVYVYIYTDSDNNLTPDTFIYTHSDTYIYR
jgi:hypothetical protein